MTLKEIAQELVERTKKAIVNDIDRHLWLDEELCPKKEQHETSNAT